ncbi:MAG: hypothetical protein JKY95_09485 [Planctomycetaceae bacterium]|nr:hypothetical protein [Planctomycetaceae bacterium]
MSEIPTFPLASKVAIAFRGYNVTNAGRTAELLDDHQVGQHLTDRLVQAQDFYAELMGEKVDYFHILRNRIPSTLETYTADLAMIVAIELAHWDTLLDLLGEEKERIQVVMGYSLGEVTATIATGIFTYEAAMKPILTLCGDAAELASDVTMGILFSRGTSIELEAIHTRCEEITSQGNGVLAISTHLSPNTVLMLGQGDTIDVFKKTMKDFLPKSVHLRKNSHHWPPLHTPIVLQKHLRDRAALILQTTPYQQTLPNYPLLSCVTGKIANTGLNSRKLMMDWIDHPQLLWDCIHAMLAMGIEQVVHLGPEPNIVPATLTRLAENVQLQIDQPSWVGYGLRTISKLAARRPWLTNLISRDAVLLRAPHVEQLVLEDWLLDSHGNQPSESNDPVTEN